jgi:hypothetical protein
LAQSVWTTTDCRGRRTTLHESNWLKHVAKRPEIAGLEEQAKATVEDPNFCVRETDDSINYYKSGVVPGRPRAYVHVVARDDPDGTNVRSVWICFDVDPFEEFLCTAKIS